MSTESALPKNNISENNGEKMDTPSVPPLIITAQHRKPFEEASAYITETYGKSPSPEDLMRLWLSNANLWEIVDALENAVRGMADGDAMPNPDKTSSEILDLP